jgi:type I restriction enzyme M protein
MLVEKFLYAVVSLPAGLFNPYSGVKTSILFLDRQLAAKSDSVLFVKVENDGFGLGAQRRAIEQNDLPGALQVIKDFQEKILNHKGAVEPSVRGARRKKGEGEVSNVLIVAKVKIAEIGDFNLTGDRYRVVERRGKQKWPMVRLGDVCEIIAGQSPEGQYYNEQGNGTPFYQGKTEFTEKYIGNPVKWTTHETKIAEKDDVLMSVRAPVGPVNIATQRICIGRGLAVIRPSPDILLVYLFTLLKLQEKDIKGNGGAVFDSISKKDIEAIMIPLPPIEVQQEIVARIEGYQKIIDGARQVVDNWKPQIEVDPDWPMVKLGDVCEINPKKAEVSSLADDTLVSFLPMEDIGMVQDIYPKKDRPISEVFKGYSYFRENDVLIAKVTPCFENGKGGIARNLKSGIGFGSTEIHVVRASNAILPEYIYPFVSSNGFLTNGKAKMTGTGGLQRLPAQYVADLEIPLPPIDIQREIVAKIEAERKAVDGCRELMVRYEGKIKKVVDGIWGNT